MSRKNPIDWKILLALAAVYITWSTTYIAIRIAVHELPPFIMNGSRFIAAGVIMIVMALFTGQKLPPVKQWQNASIIGVILFLGGTGALVMSEVSVSSSLAAIGISSTPLWVCLLTGLTGKWPNKFEWTGLAIGFSGIVMLNLENGMQFNTLGAVMLLLSPVLWALGSVLSRKIKIPDGFMGYGIEMLAGGLANLAAAFVIGERFTAMPSFAGVISTAYLGIFGSIVGFSCYMFLFKHTRPALATSYAYVNPVGAVLIGVLFAGETIKIAGVGALIAVVLGVIFVIRGEIADRKAVA